MMLKKIILDKNDVQIDIEKKEVDLRIQEAAKIFRRVSSRRIFFDSYRKCNIDIFVKRNQENKKGLK